jgi:hypothetical protein
MQLRLSASLYKYCHDCFLCLHLLGKALVIFDPCFPLVSIPYVEVIVAFQTPRKMGKASSTRLIFGASFLVKIPDFHRVSLKLLCI